jgi:ABC-type branched-subunit amino acid transport system ATPase component
MGGYLVQGTGLSCAFGGINAVAGVDVVIGSRDLLCVIGPNGAGKSTLVGLLSGAITSGAGELYLDGERMTGRPMHQCSAQVSGHQHVPHDERA